MYSRELGASNVFAPSACVRLCTQCQLAGGAPELTGAQGGQLLLQRRLLVLPRRLELAAPEATSTHMPTYGCNLS